jgi:hypothetical protein
MGPKSCVSSHLTSVCAILAIESMEVGTFHFTHGSKSVGPKYDMDSYMATLFGYMAWNFTLRVKSSKKLD